MRGVYITSTLAQRHMDTEKNVGFVIRYKAESGGDLIRRNTRALDSGAANDEQREQNAKKQQKPGDAGRFLAFKALPPRSNISTSDAPDTPENEVEVVKGVCDEIARVANKAQGGTGRWNVPDTAQEGLDYEGQNRQLNVEEKDIIGLADAKKTTGYLEQIEYSLKKLVWG
jgi:hypothetical protein